MKHHPHWYNTTRDDARGMWISVGLGLALFAVGAISSVL